MDYDLRGSAIEDYYAQFARRRLPDFALVALADASLRLPRNHIGFEAWITIVAGVNIHVRKLRAWSLGFGHALGRAHRRGNRKAKWVTGWADDWGTRASLDGLAVALFGKDQVPSSNSRIEEFKCRRESYQQVRAVVACAVTLQVSEFSAEIHRVVAQNGAGQVSRAMLDIEDDSLIPAQRTP